MTFTEKQIKDLSAPLSPDVVRQRQQAGRKLDYIEAWHAISEANRIFGFDGWSRETVEMRLVSEREVTIGRGTPREKQGWSVSYVSKVRVRVGDLIREGTGSGHGIDADLGQAHESAAKESESDAMKRALITFGNPFGLALYDKERANVGEPEADEPPPRQTVHVGSTKDARGRKIYDILRSEMTAIKTSVTLRAWGENHKKAVNELPPDWRDEFKDLYRAHLLDLIEKEKAMTEAADHPAYAQLIETIDKTKDLSSFERDWADEIAALPTPLQTSLGQHLDRARVKG